MPIPRSRNRACTGALLARLDSLGDGITRHDLYEAYPEQYIDVAREQQLLRAHDLIVLQHPFYWYSTPAILKEWQDLVLEHGFAYGTDGVALQGKQMLSVISTGGGAESYGRGALNHFTVREFLAPLEQTARFCGMEYLPPFVIPGAFEMSDAQIEAHAEEYARTLAALRDGTFDLTERARARPS